MPRFMFPQERPGLAPGGLLRGLGERRMEPVTPPPEEIPGAATREIVEEPLEKELPPGVEQTYLETPQEPFLAQLGSYLSEQEFSAEDAAQLINAIITAPTGRATGKTAARGKVAGKAATSTFQSRKRTIGSFARAMPSVMGRRQVVGGPIARLPIPNWLKQLTKSSKKWLLPSVPRWFAGGRGGA